MIETVVGTVESGAVGNRSVPRVCGGVTTVLGVSRCVLLPAASPERRRSRPPLNSRPSVTGRTEFGSLLKMRHCVV